MIANLQHLQQYSIQSLERDYKYYYFIIRGDSEKYNRKGGGIMRKELEYAKKIALVRKLFRAGGLSEAEYNRVRAKLMDMYHVIENDLEKQSVLA